MTLTIRISLSAGATRRAGNNKVVIRKVASELASRSFWSWLLVCFEKIFGIPMCLCSCANTMASRRCSFPVRNLVQNARIDEGDDKSHSSAYICSFEVVERSRSTRMETFDDSIGSGESAMICAPR